MQLKFQKVGFVLKVLFLFKMRKFVGFFIHDLLKFNFKG